MRTRHLGHCLALAALLLPLTARAADHQDGPAASADPASDITDVFAWMAPDTAHVYLVMDVFPAATASSNFSNTTQYVFHTNAAPAFGSAATATRDIICTFDTGTPQKISCWAGSSYVTGDASSTNGITSSDGKLKVFAGLRDDPFFFNLDGFKDAAADAHASAGNLTFNAGGCPDLTKSPTGSSKTYQQILFADLTHTAHGNGPAVDHFAKLNVLSIALQVDKNLILQGGGPTVGVWASTNH